ncbi:MAG: RNA polymerase sigma-70 factor [Balneolaceae bacterium]
MDIRQRNNRLINQLRSGSKDAFEELYCIYNKRIYGMALRYVKDPQLAEDAVQDVFIKLWDYRHNLKEGKSIQGFLFSTLKHHVLNMIREHERRIGRQYEYSILNKTVSERSDQKVLLSDYDRIFNEGFQQLPERKQLVFRLKRVNGLSDQQIATRLNISKNTVKSQFYRASKFIRKFMAVHADLK